VVLAFLLRSLPFPPKEGELSLCDFPLPNSENPFFFFTWGSTNREFLLLCPERPRLPGNSMLGERVPVEELEGMTPILWMPSVLLDLMGRWLGANKDLFSVCALDGALGVADRGPEPECPPLSGAVLLECTPLSGTVLLAAVASANFSTFFKLKIP